MSKTEALTLKRREPLTDTNLLFTITVCVFVGMYALSMLIFGGKFLTVQQFLDLFNNNAFLIIIACGLSMVMVVGGIDISVGGITALVAMSCVFFLDSGFASGLGGGGSVLGSLVLALTIGLGFGLLHGVLVALLDIQPFIVTLSGMFLARGLTTIISVNPYTAKNTAFLTLKNLRIELPGLGRTIAKTGAYIPATIELGVLIALVVVLVAFVILKWSRFGRNLYAVGGNNQSALMLGINVKRTKFFAYLASGLLAGIAGYVYLLHTGSGDAAHATAAEMKAIASSIIGGTLLTGGVGNVIGTLFGALTLMTIDQIVLSSPLTGAWWQDITTGAMLCFFILLQSVVLSRRHGSKMKLALPEWLKFKKKSTT